MPIPQQKSLVLQGKFAPEPVSSSQMTRASAETQFFSRRVAESGVGRAILEKPSVAPECGGAYLVCRLQVGRKCRWGVVQPVGHHTVNVDGEGSNPSAPANFPIITGTRSLPLRSRQTCIEPAAPAAVHRFHVGVAHFLQIIGGERGAETAAAI
jgi:hypothetical protein